MKAGFDAPLQIPDVGLNSVRTAIATCGCNEDLIDAINDNDVATMKDLSLLKNSDVETLSKTLSSMPVAQGG